MGNIAETVKKQTDRILRQRALNGSEGVVVSGVASGTGAPAPTINSPRDDVDAVKIRTKPVNIPGFAGKDGYILAYDETADEFYLKADDGGGGGESTFTFFARSNKTFFAWDDFGFTTINAPV